MTKDNPTFLPHGPSIGDDDPAANLLTCASLAEWFKDMVCNAVENQGLSPSVSSEYYVVGVLESYADADEFFGLDDIGQRKDQALAMMLNSAVHGSGHDRVNHYRRLGDVALFVSGFFTESLRRRTVGVTYYMGMGQGAYSTLSDMFRRQPGGQVFSEIFEELADTFPDWVEVLREVSERSLMAAPAEDLETAEIVGRLSRVKGKRRTELSAALLKRGVWPSVV